MVNDSRRPSALRLPVFLGAVAMCASLALFIAAPSAWGSSPVDGDLAATTIAVNDALVAPHALVESAPQFQMIFSVAVAIVLLAELGVAVGGCTRRRESLSARLARTRALHWTQRRGPPRLRHAD
jgi:hypothetical protein